MKEFLRRKGVSFTERDIRQDPSALQELLDLGVRATPATMINGEVVVGLDERRFTELLGQGSAAGV